MKNSRNEKMDEIRSEYDLKKLRVRKMGSARSSFASHTVLLEPDVAALFPDSQSVNEALRFLVRVTKNNNPITLSS